MGVTKPFGMRVDRQYDRPGRNFEALIVEPAELQSRHLVYAVDGDYLLAAAL